MSDHQHTHLGAAHRLNSFCYLLDSIDVETRVNFIQQHDPWFEHRHLEDFGALLLSTGQVVVH